jgi:PAS domain S-box-containing protein
MVEPTSTPAPGERALAAEQAALKRVATLVARETNPSKVLAAAAREVAELLGAQTAIIARYEADGTASVLGGYGEQSFQPGTVWRLDGPSAAAEVRRTGKPARWADSGGPDDGDTLAAARRMGLRSSIGVPITVDGNVWGVIVVATTLDVPIEESAEARLVDFTELVGIAIANTETREETRRLADEQAALRRVATLAARDTDPAAIFFAVAEEVANLIGVPAISLIRFEEDGAASKLAGWGSSPLAVGERWIPEGVGIVGEVMRTGQSARVDDYTAVKGPYARALREAGIRAGVGAPILVDGSTWGVILAFSTDAQLPPGSERRLVAFTELVETAIARTQARDDLRHLADEQAALRRVATLIARQVTPGEVFAAVAEEVARTLHVPLTAVVRFERDGTATQVGAWGAENPFPVGTNWLLDEASVSGTVARTGVPARVEDYAEVPGEISTRLALEAGIRTAVGVPVLVDAEPWGLIMALSTEEHALESDVEVRLAAFTELIATAISNAQARDQVTVFVREQEALRRVATLAAAGAPPQNVFDAVVEEVRVLLDLSTVALTRYEPDNTILIVAVSGGSHPFQIGTRWPVEGLPVASVIRESRSAAHIDEYVTQDATVGTAIRKGGIRSGVGAPIIVDGQVWGSISAASIDGPLAPGTEYRLTAFTELIATTVLNALARDELRALADEQAALRRVATLVAEGAGSPAIYDAICQETAAVIGATSVNLARFTADRFNLTVAGWSLRDTHIPTGTRLPIEGGTINELVYEHAAPARIESYDLAQGALADLIRERGIESEVATPVIVNGRPWGILVAGWDTDGPPPDGAEQRLARFAELVATAVSNAATRSELIASRARIVTAGDDARRRIERNLHDGTQQRLVALGLDLQTVRAGLGTADDGAQTELERIGHELEAVLEDVRELSRGLHPALLSQAGLRPSLRALARRSPIPVSLEIDVHERPAESIEIAVYYVVSEALTNAAKYSHAENVAVAVTTDDNRLRATIEDDGVGGAEASGGSGLVGLIDRVEALGGRFSIESPPREGTRIAIDLPLSPPDSEAIVAPAAAPPHSHELAHIADPGTLLSALAHILGALYIVDARGHIRYLNKSALGILGYDHETQLLGRGSHDTIHHSRPDGQSFPASECPLLRPRVTGETVRVAADWFIRQDGSFVPVSYVSGPLVLADGRGAVVLFSERTTGVPARPS